VRASSTPSAAVAGAGGGVRQSALSARGQFVGADEEVEAGGEASGHEEWEEGRRASGRVMKPSGASCDVWSQALGSSTASDGSSRSRSVSHDGAWESAQEGGGLGEAAGRGLGEGATRGGAKVLACSPFNHDSLRASPFAVTVCDLQLRGGPAASAQHQPPPHKIGMRGGSIEYQVKLSVRGCKARSVTAAPCHNATRASRYPLLVKWPDTFDLLVEGEGSDLGESNADGRCLLVAKVVKVKKASADAYPVESVEGVCRVPLLPPANSQTVTRWKWHDLVAPTSAAAASLMTDRSGGSQPARVEAGGGEGGRLVGLQLYMGLAVAPPEGGRVAGQIHSAAVGEEGAEKPEAAAAAAAGEGEGEGADAATRHVPPARVWEVVQEEAMTLQRAWRCYLARSRAVRPSSSRRPPRPTTPAAL